MLRSVPPLPGTEPRGPGTDARPTERGDDEPPAGPLDIAAAYRGYAARVACWAERLSGPGADLEDVVHDVFMVAQKRHHEWRGEAKLSTWLYQITIRVVQRRRRVRRRWRWLPFFNQDATEVDWGASSALPAAPAPTPIDLLERRSSHRLLYELLEELDEKYRTALILFEIEGLPGKEIAALTGTTVANVWVRIMRGRAELARRLEARESGKIGKNAAKVRGASARTLR